MFESVKYPVIGVCGLSCVLCPNHNREGESRCPGCKTQFRFGAACPMLRCALKSKGVEFCWDCQESSTCEKWQRHREFSKDYDSFICYQRLEDNISYAREHGVSAFEEAQNERAHLLNELLSEFNEGRSKSYYCIAATVLSIEELKGAIALGRSQSASLDSKGKAKLMRAIIEGIAQKKAYVISLRSRKSK